MLWEKLKDTHNALVSDPISRDKLDHIMSHIHLCDNAKLEQNDKLAKLRPLFEHLNKKFLEYAFFEEYHSIDECIDLTVNNAWQIHRKKKEGNHKSALETVLEENKNELMHQIGRPFTFLNQLKYDLLAHLVVLQTQQTRCEFCYEENNKEVLEM
ncbi:hypothetical protein ILUMI_09270 [Ignelater luminosus]|uniref:PiggyBac transposable element-derived protein domain-containing protein n=1 Tax=Ignelater luminosus TaxID=2038154 RepID=A0A8K0GCL5_IGNLU|nr:hypothetical protein ILUMI_09270 [Ignelater luminosus]